MEVPAKTREKTLNRIKRELCESCTETVPRDERHYCRVKGAMYYEAAVFMVECPYCKKMLKDAKQMFYHSMIEHLGVLCWGCPFCKRCFQNRNSYLRHIQWGHKGIPKFKKRIIDEFGAVMPCPVVEGD